jgi:hypothetical protein
LRRAKPSSLALAGEDVDGRVKPSHDGFEPATRARRTS